MSNFDALCRECMSNRPWDGPALWLLLAVSCPIWSGCSAFHSRQGRVIAPGVTSLCPGNSLLSRSLLKPAYTAEHQAESVCPTWFGVSQLDRPPWLSAVRLDQAAVLSAQIEGNFTCSRGHEPMAWQQAALSNLCERHRSREHQILTPLPALVCAISAISSTVKH